MKMLDVFKITLTTVRVRLQLKYRGSSNIINYDGTGLYRVYTFEIRLQTKFRIQDETPVVIRIFSEQIFFFFLSPLIFMVIKCYNLKTTRLTNAKSGVSYLQQPIK